MGSRGDTMTSGWIMLARSKPDSDTHRRVRYAAREQEVDDDSGAAARCGAALLLLAALAPAPALAQGTPQPVFTELFAYDPADPWQLLEKWVISSHLDRQLRPLRVGVVEDSIGKTVGRVTVQEGDGLDGASEAMLQARHYVCDSKGSRAAAIGAELGGIVPSERAEMQVRSDRATGAGELVKFGQPGWYRFSFKIAADWPQDVPAAGRQPCRTVIHQIKQDSFKGGKSCSASPFFKIEARPLGERMRFLSDCATKSPIVTTPTRSTCGPTTPASAAAASSPTAATSGRGLSTCAGAASTTGAVRAHLGPERPVSARLLPRNSARVTAPATSEPLPGSLNNWHQISSPVRMRSRNFSFCQSVPCSRIVAAARVRIPTLATPMAPMRLNSSSTDGTRPTGRSRPYQRDGQCGTPHPDSASLRRHSTSP